MIEVEVKALCAMLERLEEQLTEGSITFEAAHELWDSTYEPRALELAQAMLFHVPGGDPKIHVVSSVGNLRIIGADILNCINAPFLDAELAIGQLATVRGQLENLTKYLPASDNS